MYSPRFLDVSVMSSFLDELEKISMVTPPRQLSVKGARGFSHGVAKTTRPIPVKAIAPRVITGKLLRSMKKAEKKAPFGSKHTWGIQSPQLLGQLIPKKRRGKKK